MLDRYLGCFFGLAIGDAIGFPIEFRPLQEIQRRYGPLGITTLPENGLYSDDTQMSLATADGLIGVKEGGDPTDRVYREYLRWFDTQKDPRQRRAPGGTCLSALANGSMGTVDNRLNNSKGCGGVMRTAPAGLACAPAAAFQYGVEFAAITHSHPSGYLSAGFLSQLISHLSLGEELRRAVSACREMLAKYEGHEEVLSKVEQACDLADQKTNVIMAINSIGGGWTGEEALGIALYCALRFSNEWKSGVLAAANHSGDSDSTASIAGAILGTRLGLNAIPAGWVERVEDSHAIRAKAIAMHECYASERIVNVQTPLSAFPISVKCPVCMKPLRVPKAGTYSCPDCKTGLSFDHTGKIFLV